MKLRRASTSMRNPGGPELQLGLEAETVEKAGHVLGNATIQITRKHYFRKPDVVNYTTLVLLHDTRGSTQFRRA